MKLGVWVPTSLAGSMVLQLYASNAQKMPFSESWRALAAAMLLGMLCYLVARGFARDDSRATVLSTIWIVSIFAYGPLSGSLSGLPEPLGAMGRLRVLLPATLLVGLAAAFALRRGPERAFLATFARSFAVIAIVLSVAQAGLAKRGHDERRELSLPSPPLTLPAQAPDVYYVVLDAYGRADILQSHYGYDNSAFLQALEQRGFDVLEWSRSNYTNTVFSMASTLSLEYLDDVVAQLELGPGDEKALHDLVRQPHVPELFRGAGYEFVAFATGVAATEMKGADRYLRSPAQIREFESVVLQSTPLASLLARTGIPLDFAGRRSGIRFTLERMGRLPATGRPRFVLAHLLNPHSPFVFGPAGEARNPRMSHPSSDGSDYLENASAESYRRGYVDQLIHLNARLLETVDAILANANTPPVIILQGDHGPRLGLDWDDVEASDIAEVSSTLCAIYAPALRDDRIPEDLCSVNTFRFVLREIFGAPLEDLPYRFEASPRNDLYGFVDRTDATLGPPEDQSRR